MRKIKVKLIILVLLVLASVSLIGCSGDEGSSYVEVDAYYAINNASQVNSSNVNDYITSSYSYGELDVYYIKLGEMDDVPIFYTDAYIHEGLDYSYTYEESDEKSETTATSVTSAYSTTQTVLNSIMIGANTSITLTNSISATIEAEAEFGIAEVKAGLTESSTAEYAWSAYTEGTYTTQNEITQEKVNTVESTISYITGSRESRTLTLSAKDATGYYRYTVFVDAEVYLYMIIDNDTKNIYYEIQYVTIEGSRYTAFWFSDSNRVEKTNDTYFDFDASITENLPSTKYDITDYDITEYEDSSKLLQEQYTREFTAFETEQKIVDGSDSSNTWSYSKSFALNLNATEMKADSIDSIKIEYWWDMKEANDGYQQFLFKIQGIQVALHEYEHTAGKADTNYESYYKSFTVSLDAFNDEMTLDMYLDCHGFGANTWYIKNLTIKVSPIIS